MRSGGAPARIITGQDAHPSQRDPHGAIVGGVLTAAQATGQEERRCMVACEQCGSTSTAMNRFSRSARCPTGSRRGRGRRAGGDGGDEPGGDRHPIRRHGVPVPGDVPARPGERPRRAHRRGRTRCDAPRRRSAGDRALGLEDAQSELALLPAARLVPKPDALDWHVAATLYVAGTTALAALQTVPIGSDDTAVIAGAAGGVGVYLTQLAVGTGATVIAVAGRANHEWLRAHGAEPVEYGAGPRGATPERCAERDHRVLRPPRPGLHRPGHLARREPRPGRDDHRLRCRAATRDPGEGHGRAGRSCGGGATARRHRLRGRVRGADQGALPAGTRRRRRTARSAVEAASARSSCRSPPPTTLRGSAFPSRIRSSRPTRRSGTYRTRRVA